MNFENKKFLINQNQFKDFGILANETIAQPNGLSYIGTANDLKNLAAFVDFQKKQGIFNFFFEKDLEYDFADIPAYYRNYNTFSNLKNIKEVLLIGTFPRYEASIFNTYIRKILNKYKKKIYTISNWNENNYEISHLGNSVKTTFEFLKGKHFLNQKVVNTKSFLITTSLNFYTTKYLTNNFYLNKILMKKNYLNFNSNNILNVITPNLSNLIAKEFLFTNNAKSWKLYDNYNTTNYYNIENIFGLNIQEKFLNKKFLKNLEKKNTSLILFSTHNWNTKNIQSSNQMQLPIQNFFEKNNFVLNLDGKIQESIKITSTANNQIKDLFSVVENFYYYLDEKTSFTERKGLKKILNKNLGGLVEKKLNKSSNFFKKFSTNSQNFLENNFIQNFNLFYKKKNSFNFYNIQHITKFYKKKIKLYTYTNQIKNFYQTDLLSIYSYTMSLTTLFTELNNSLKKEQSN